MTIPDDVYRRTEGILYRYFRNLRRLRRLEAEIEELERQVAYLKHEIDRGIHLAPTVRGVRYFEGVNESPGSPIEGALERDVERLERLEREHARLTGILIDKKLHAQDLRRKVVPVSAVLETFSEDDRTIIEKRYDEPRWSYTDIGDLISWSRSSVHRRAKELVAIVADALDVGRTPTRSFALPYSSGSPV